MEDKILSVFLGEQCRKYRKMRGLTQEDLAEKLNTTAQTISNYERSGIRDVDVEEQIASILKVNLREETADKEGTVGEVGKELLFSMISNGGILPVEYILKDVLHGMDIKRVGHEIEKLAELDMCCRDRYIDFKGLEKDDVFITAKGIITYKNMVSDKYHVDELQEYLPNVRSYEEVLKPHRVHEYHLPMACDMEEYIQLRPWRIEINKIPFWGNYMADYIAYLYKNWAYDGPIRKNKYVSLVRFDFVFPGINIYHDILYRMSLGLTNAWRSANYFCDIYSEEESDYYESLIDFDEVYGLVTEGVVTDSIKEFKKEFPWVKDYGYRSEKHTDPFVKAREVGKEKEVKEFFDYLDNSSLNVSTIEQEIDRQELYTENAPEGKENLFPDKLFDKEEIVAFIKENFKKPENERECAIRDMLAKINDMIPSAKDEYFSFPKEWEENGIADLLREVCEL